MTYELIGEPRIEPEYSDSYETVMVCDLRREDGVTGDVWIVAGVPRSDRGSSDAARTQEGYLTVRVFGDSPDHWCPESFRPDEGEGDYREISDSILQAVRKAALAVHRAAILDQTEEEG
jgi:hypothetical protein